MSPTVDTGVQTGPQNRAPGAGRQSASARGGPVGGQQQYQRRGGPPYQNPRGGMGNNHGLGVIGGPKPPNQQHQHQPQHNNFNQPQNQMGRGGGYRGRGGMMGGGMRGRGGPFQGGFRSQQQHFGGNGNFDRPAFGGRGGGYHMRGGRGAGGHPRDGQEQRVKYDGDYDFEKANEQFQETLTHLKEEIHKVKIEVSDDKEVEKGETKKSEDSGTEMHAGEGEEHDANDKAHCYDKAKSFFDTISCEALERAEGNAGRPNWRKERELNQETFGQSAVRNYQYRRGQPRGAGAGGYRRGGYGGGANFRGGYNKYR